MLFPKPARHKRSRILHGIGGQTKHSTSFKCVCFCGMLEILLRFWDGYGHIYSLGSCLTYYCTVRGAVCLSFPKKVKLRRDAAFGQIGSFCEAQLVRGAEGR